ncbi:MAG: hypothetical protein KatS3mg003_1890 [Candidatus Nitrosocaldaceae archaeon]|nr:MAG: hypothetical protein KatS3mg003_1890 [Candidatus Nitrosocaldaceae archaeon]
MLLTAGLVYAAYTPNLMIIYNDGDRFYNHDFLSNIDPPSNYDVDWPVTMLFCNNADINKVKWIYWGPTIATPMYMKMNDGNRWVWDSDMGTKNSFWYSGYLQQWVKLHMRIYAPNPPDYMTNYNWGKYVVGTTHYDEFWLESWSGYSQYAEYDLSTYAYNKGYQVYVDSEPMYNNDNRGNINNHIWQNDGYATRVCVP